MPSITAEALFDQVEAYQLPAPSRLSLAESEPYLFAPIADKGGEIHGNDDFHIEELTDADLDCPLDIA